MWDIIIDDIDATLVVYDEFLDRDFAGAARSDLVPGFLIDPATGFGIHAEVLAAARRLKTERSKAAMDALDELLDRLDPAFKALQSPKQSIGPDGTILIEG